MIKFQKFIRRQDLKDNPNTVFLFGDNLERQGLGGQAKEIRGEPNALGIVTKKKPSHASDAFFTDDEYDMNCQAIDTCFLPLESIFKDRDIVIPEDGIGTGLAQLDTRAPKTFAHLQKKLTELIARHTTKRMI